MIIKYEFIGLRGKKPHKKSVFRRFLLTITNGQIDYAMTKSSLVVSYDMMNIKSKKISNEALKKIVEDIDMYILTLIDAETEQYGRDINDDTIVMGISVCGDHSDDLENSVQVGFSGSRKISDTSHTAIRIKKVVEMLAECLAIDGIELSYDRLKIDGEIIELDN